MLIVAIIQRCTRSVTQRQMATHLHNELSALIRTHANNNANGITYKKKKKNTMRASLILCKFTRQQKRQKNEPEIINGTRVCIILPLN